MSHTYKGRGSISNDDRKLAIKFFILLINASSFRAADKISFVMPLYLLRTLERYFIQELTQTKAPAASAIGEMDARKDGVADEDDFDPNDADEMVGFRQFRKRQLNSIETIIKGID